jgi:hypothetical protein
MAEKSTWGTFVSVEPSLGADAGARLSRTVTFCLEDQ